MTGKNARQNAFLRLVSGKESETRSVRQRYSLTPTSEAVIGRDPHCQVVLDALKYRMVSRRHAILRPLSLSPDGEISWILCDLDSANGTYLNGKRLQECQQVFPGDRITLGYDGPSTSF